MTEPLRIVSLIPSATEIVASLGLVEYLVGRSHECDYPIPVQSLPACTQPQFNPSGSSGEIHQRVTNVLESALSVYRVETDLLRQLQPTHILTQDQCEVCACSLADVEAAVKEAIDSQPQIISLQPNTLAEVWGDIARVAQQLGVDACDVLNSLQSRVNQVTAQAQSLEFHPTVACIEWVEPLMIAGNWIPELVQLAGGQPILATSGQHSPWVDWQALVEADPDIVVLMPCGFDLTRTRQDLAQLAERSQWQQLKAVQHRQVYVTDGNAFFNRPGPRLVDSLCILAEMFHPELFAFGYRGMAWEVA
ncbi:MAG: cobalamin-binding protein [Desertifilum sp. SIO1I2]|nr:cobalamin-binding protein [Desertifilum sp. SIO1I2]